MERTEQRSRRQQWTVPYGLYTSQTLRDKGLEADYSLELQSWWVGWFFPSEDIKTWKLKLDEAKGVVMQRVPPVTSVMPLDHKVGAKLLAHPRNQ